MSSRALRKLHGNSDIIVPELPDDDNTSDVEIENEDIQDSGENLGAKPKKKKNKKKTAERMNPFAMLVEDGGDNDNVNQDVTEDIEEKEEEKEQIEPPVQNKKKKKKKKKSKKDTNDNKNAAHEDEIDASIREVSRILGEDITSGAAGSVVYEETNISSTMKAVLAIEHKNLNPDNEMRKIFGSRVVQGEQRRGGRRSHGVYHRNSWLARPTDAWPHMSKTGLSMELVDNKHGNLYFTFEHNKAYQQVQFNFLDAVESLDPQNIVQVLNQQPYHIDSLLQLSEICKMSDDTPMATQLIERALYSFECCFHTRFSLTQGNCRLDYRRPENRAFYMALYRHLIFVGQRGCNKTALEFCKLILSLDPDGDPLCILLLIDFYALRCEEYAFIIRMFTEWESHRNLSQLPNFAFSMALATFLHTHESGNTEKADKMLQEALIMFPGILLPLLDKCSIQPDTRVASHSFFSVATNIKDPEALQQLMQLYVGRCHSCWKAPEVVTWLESNVKVVLDRVDKKDNLINQFRNKRRSRYQGTPRNIYRHIVMSEIKEASASLPPDITNSPILSYDPLPPKDSFTSYKRPERTRVAQTESGALSSFFRSLLPNYNPQELVDQGAAQGAVGGNGAELRQGVGALMDAMRDLLNNIRPVEPPVEGQNQEGQEGDDIPPEEWD